MPWVTRGGKTWWDDPRTAGNDQPSSGSRSRPVTTDKFGGRSRPGGGSFGTAQVGAPPTAANDGTRLRPAPSGPGRVDDSGGDGGGDGGYAASVARANQAGKDRSARENAATQQIIDALMRSLSGFEKGRDVQIANANQALEDTLAGILANYTGAITQYDTAADVNDQNYDSVSQSVVQNRARERMSLLQQAASQGAGETDQLRAQVQAFLNGFANQSEADTARSDTEQNILSQIAGAGTQAESQRRGAKLQQQEAIGSAQNEFYKNWSDTATAAQRAAASNSNVESESSVGFNANFGGRNIVDEASKYAGKVYKQEKVDDKWAREFDGRTRGRRGRTNSSERAATTTIAAPKAAEGATLRGRAW